MSSQVNTASNGAAGDASAGGSSPRTGRIDLTLERIRALLDSLGNPQHAFPVIHVAGTNGKGSTIAYLDALLRDVVGVRTGTFTSPHLLTARDSCRIGGQPIDEDNWNRAIAIVQEQAEQCSPFELLTAQCFVAFGMLSPATRPEVLVIEVGMGGALDATNVFNDRQVLASVIAAIDLDHQALLGNTLGEIARQKAGIVKRNGLCILADQRRGSIDGEVDQGEVLMIEPVSGADNTAPSAITEAVRSICAEQNARLVRANVPWKDLDREQPRASGSAAAARPGPISSPSLVRFSPILSRSRSTPGKYVAASGDNVVPGPSVQLPATRASLMGAHLALQTLFSIARDETPCGLGLSGSDASEDLRLAVAFALRDEENAQARIRNCLCQVQLAGRAEWQKRALPGASSMGDEVQAPDAAAIQVLIDGAHNPAAAVALGGYVNKCMQLVSDRQGEEEQATVTWILAFSQGKDAGSILNALIDASKQVRHRFAFVPFSTPVEGMPWVKPAPLKALVELAEQTKRERSNVEDIVAFDQAVKGITPLQQALQWSQRNISAEKQQLVVIAGSLYLVSDAHRLLAGDSTGSSTPAKSIDVF